MKLIGVFLQISVAFSEDGHIAAALMQSLFFLIKPTDALISQIYFVKKL